MYTLYLQSRYLLLCLIAEITAANKSNVCTYAVLGPQQVAQPVSTTIADSLF